jgi:hypothetical protein
MRAALRPFSEKIACASSCTAPLRATISDVDLLAHRLESRRMWLGMEVSHPMFEVHHQQLLLYDRRRITESQEVGKCITWAFTGLRF